MRRPTHLLLLVAAILLDASACYALAGAAGVTNDFFPRWLATRLWLDGGQDLYSPETDAAIRASIGPPPLGGDRFVFGFVYPAYVALALVPFALVPLRIATTAWLLLLQAAIIGGTLLVWRAHERERRLLPSPPLAPLVTAILLPATAFNFIFLQFSSLAYFSLALVWWLLTRRRDRGAGVALLPALLKPQLALLPLAALLASAVAEHRTRFLVTACGASTALLVTSLAAFPSWPERFVRSTLAYGNVAHPYSAATLLASIATPSPAFGAALLALVVGLVLWAWSSSPRALGDGLAASSLLSLWLVPPLYEWNNVLLLIILVPALRSLRGHGAGTLWLGCAVAVASSALTAWAYTVWPSECRLIWPLLALAVYVGAAARRVGSQSVTSSTPAPSLATRV